MKETHIRQSFLGEYSEQTLKELRVGVIGLCGGGSHIVQQLSHVGIGNLLIVDPDRIDLSNLNRLVGATYQDAQAKRLKIEIAERTAKAVNPSVNLTARAKPWSEVIEELRDCDIIVGCLDSYSQRTQLEAFCRRFLIPYIDLGMDVHEVGDHYVVSGQVARSIPGDVCLQCMGIITEDDVAKEAYGVAGGRPQVVWPNGLLASAAVGLLIEMVTPWYKSKRSSEFLTYNGNDQSLMRHNWMKISTTRTCSHYPANEVGDPHPFWIAQEKKTSETQRTTKSSFFRRFLLKGCKTTLKIFNF